MKTFLTSLKGKLIVGLSTLGVVGAVVAAAIIINSGYRTIVVDGSNGSTEIVNGSDVNEAYVGLHLKSGDNVTVKNTSDLTLALDQDKYVYAEENTHFWIEAKGKADDTRTVINLDEGCNLIRIDQKLKESESFEVDTPNTTVSVRGTVYRVTCRQEANGDTYTIIEVFEGEVYVAVKMENGQDTGESRYLQAGESAIVRSNSSISEFVKNEEDGTPVHPIYYSTIPKNTAKQIGRIIDSGRKLCISKELLFDIVELIEHDFTKEGERVEPTCTEPGYVTTVCSICGEESEREILPEIEHDYEYIDYPATDEHPEYREKRCKICDEVFETIEDPETEHKYGEWVIVKEPTCTEDGLKVATCEECGAKNEEVIPKLNHQYKDAIDPKTGAPIKVCERCDKKIDSPVTPASPQNPVDEILQKEKKDTGINYTPSTPTPDSGSDSPSSVDDGEGGQNNENQDDGGQGDESQSDDENQNPTPQKKNPSKKDPCADGHDYQQDSITEATCTTAGKKIEKCSRCGDTKETEIAATGHTAVSSKDNKAATCTTAGLQGKTTCSKCGEVVNAGTEIAATGHTEVAATDNKAATCTTAGLQGKTTCSKCGAVVNAGTEITATGHSYQVTGTTAATCTEAGKQTEKCTVCGDTKETTTDAALGHSETYTPSNVAAKHSVRCGRTGCTTFTNREEDCNIQYTKTSNTEHSIECSVCHRSGTESHSNMPDPTTTRGWDKDASGHSFTCNECGTVSEAHVERYTQNNSSKTHMYDCSVCGYIIETEHVFSDSGDGSTCSVCGRNFDPY